MSDDVAVLPVTVTEDMLKDAMSGVEKQISDLRDVIDARIGSVRDSIEADTRHKIDEALRLEREQRESQIAKLRDDVADVSRKTDETRDDVAKIDGKLDHLGKSIGLLNGLVAKLDGTIGSWKVAVDATMNRADELEGQVEKIASDVSILSHGQTTQSERLSQMRRTIHGSGDEDGPDSLFSLIRNLDATFTARFDAQDIALATVNTLATDNRMTVTTLIQAHKDEQERWQKRRASAIAMMQIIVSNRYALAIIGATTIGIIIGLFPDAREAILSIFQSLLAVGEAP